MNKCVTVVGAGLAGCEAAWQLAERGISVTLYEMKPEKKSPAHKSDMFAELVCSNSLRAAAVENAVGLLKEEMRRLNSFLMQCADKCQVPAGGALAVDREKFSAYVTEKIKNHPNIDVVEEEATDIEDGVVTVYAIGDKPANDYTMQAQLTEIGSELASALPNAEEVAF